MRINFTIWYAGLSGGTRAIFEVANRLSEREHKVTLTALGGSHKWFPLKVKVNYVEPPKNHLLKLYELYTRFRWRKSMRFEDIAGFCRRRLNVCVDSIKPLSEAIPDCDINVATWYPTSFAVWFSSKGESYYFLQDFWEQMRSMYEAKVFEATLRLPFYFLVNSGYTKSIVLDIKSDARVRVVGVGVDANVFYPKGGRMIEVGGRNVIMIMIRGLWYKGDDTAIKVLNEINKVEPIHALIVGPRRCLNQLRENVGITFPYTHFEHVSDEKLAKLYSSASVFLFTSRAEGFGLPPLEAIACGTPVVMTDCKGNRDFAINGYNSLIASPDDITRLAELMLKILRDNKLRERLIQGGLETAKKWTWDQATNRFEDAFKEGLPHS